MSRLAELRAAVVEAAGTIADGAEAARLERPPKPEFGDYSTNAALLLAPRVGASPREVAERLAAALAELLGTQLARTEVAGPGFLNLHLADEWFADGLSGVLEAGEGYGAGGAMPAERICIEFVSANPTGPLHVAHGRHAAYGDALARILELHGHDVTREFYINDFGTQIRRLGESVKALALGEPLPEDGYAGAYVGELVPAQEARELDVGPLSALAAQACLARIRATLERFRTRFDIWASERVLHESGSVAGALDRLAAAGVTYESEGALWFRSTRFGDDKDRVLRRSDGEPTYFAADIAYHQDKLERGFERLVDVWGADHHGHVLRMRAAFEALGGDPDSFELVIMQFVHLLDAGARSAMSKRAGEFVTLDELIDEIGVDAARYFLLSRSHDATIDVDLRLAVSESNENPVYYVQYAHARIASVLAKAGSERVAEATEGPGTSPAGLHTSERALVKTLLAFPAEVAEAADRRAPHRIAAYALSLSQDFTAFYRDCRVVGAEPRELESFRLALAIATKRTIARALDLLGVGAPETM